MINLFTKSIAGNRLLRSYSRNLFTTSVRLEQQITSNVKRIEPVHKLIHKPVHLRPYQHDCIEACLKALNNNVKRIVVSIATGGGKTVIFSNLIPKIKPNTTTSRGNKVLILVHRRELAAQAANTINRFLPNYSVEIDMGDMKASQNADITIASVQTLNSLECKRLFNYNPNDYKAIIVDECHHAVSKTYMNIFDYFNYKDSGIPIIGFSATVQRHDKIPLGKIFEKVVFNKDLLDMITENWLCDVSITPVYGSLKLNCVEITKSGDYDIGSLAKYVNTNIINELVLKTYLDRRIKDGFKSSLFFCVNIEHVKELSDLFRQNGVNCQYVTGTSSKQERQAIIDDFKNGKIDVLMNCGIFTEGTDIPNIDSIFIVRPTKSRPLLIQMIGRGLRLHDTKQKCHIIDFVDSGDTGIELSPTLNGQIPKKGTALFPQNNTRNESGIQEIESVEQVQYITYDSIHQYLENVKPKKHDDFVSFLKDELPWVRIGRKSWVLELNFTDFLRVDLESTGLYHLKKYKNVGKIIKIKPILVCKSKDLNEIFAESKLYIENNGINLYKLLMRDKALLLTKKQQDFLNKKLIDVASRSPKIDLDNFQKILNKILPEMRRYEATDLIFGFIVGGRYCLEEFIKNRILIKKNVDKNNLLA
ncbi:hypothetical protein PACTADRAFT_51675 [Pachysolen tannophilus NRRL Y-2460]|uniref:ATP-dependent helicase IRC3 n=1 Tax=Pachysolen tannophilus NRRL Y-2460 TaxID=669874 RepID=A0A1E4TQA2_PACTA|nr:hypothetical protein PACTADRAFT_51675 [Pachysolen tannophilus NRRL Y-2460]